MNEKISVRDFLPADTEKILKFREETSKISFPGLKIDKQKAKKAILRHIKKYPRTLKLAEAEGKPIGYIMFQTRKSSLGDHGHINIIFVEKKYRNRGAGTILVKSAEDWFRSKGVKRITVEVTSTNTPSLEFLRKLGYMQKRVVLEKDSGKTA